MPDSPTIDTVHHGDDFAPFSATVPLDRLMLSGLNVRHTERDADIASLAEDIAARGLKQNLVIVPAHFLTGQGGNSALPWENNFEVIAGGRRFQAMQLLVADERLSADHLVPCLVEPRSTAEETSLSENLHRVAMNPADEFDAFAAIVAEQRRQGHAETTAVAYTAKRFGVTTRHVEGRLRLAALAPEILEALRKNAITLDSAKAYAGSTDQDLQRRVFVDQCKPNAWKPHDPRSVRDALRGITLPLDAPLVRYVGLSAYRKAGGRTEVEMFMGTDGEERALDVPLLADLARAKAEKALPAWVKKQGWQDALLPKGRIDNGGIAAAPAGFTRQWYDWDTLDKVDRATRIAIIRLNGEADGFWVDGCFQPEEPTPEHPAYTPKTPEEREAERLAEAADVFAARLALGSLAGTPLEGKAYWENHRWMQVYWEWPEEDQDQAGDPAFGEIKLTIRLPYAEIAAQRAVARAMVEAEEDELAAAKAAAQAGE